MCSQRRNRNGSCSPCQFKEIYRPWVKGHKVLKCTLCENEMRRESDLKRHFQTARNSKSHKCHICKKEFTRRDNLTRHMKSNHDVNGRKKCRYCQKSVSRNDAVKRHEKNCPQRDGNSTAPSTPDSSPKSPDPEINVVD